MSHKSEIAKSLKIYIDNIRNLQELSQFSIGHNVGIIVLPASSTAEQVLMPHTINEIMANALKTLESEATLVTLGEIPDLVHAHASLKDKVHFQHWISIKRAETISSSEKNFLPRNHFGALVHTLYEGPLRHSKTRIGYTYCPECEKTTKDYGGKKNSYHHFGTLISDVWRDISCNLDDDLTPVLQRFSDLFSVHPYNKLQVFDLRQVKSVNRKCKTKRIEKDLQITSQPTTTNVDKLFLGDCIENLKFIPDNSVDYIFVDPPYNLRKKYDNFSDDLKITEYFQWCDQWLGELVRVLRPGRTLSILNIPLHAIRHFLYLETVLQFQNWITWDALSFPVRKIMPSHYAILSFSKGKARTLPSLANQFGNFCSIEPSNTFEALRILKENYCRRTKCVLRRRNHKVKDRGTLTDLWGDVHRLRHNSRRVNHPTQLPPQLLYRLISIFTAPGEVVLDCFNGSGTTTLTAEQLGRKYIGIEHSESYYQLAYERHEEISRHLDPFRKKNLDLTVKNNGAQRLGKIKYEVPKNELQLEVKRIAEKLSHLPTREELTKYSKYPISYFEDYFSSWGEVYAAARTTGMTETRPTVNSNKNGDKKIDSTQSSHFYIHSSNSNQIE